MPKIIISKNDLPPVSFDDVGYNIKLRLISEDGNRTSYLTPLYTVTASVSPTASVNATVSVTAGSSGKIINVVWDKIDNIERDVYIKVKPPGGSFGNWEIKATTSTNSALILVPVSVTGTFLLSIQKSTYPKKQDNAFQLYVTPSEITI